jgi:hypothetical protein
MTENTNTVSENSIKIEEEKNIIDQMLDEIKTQPCDNNTINDTTLKKCNNNEIVIKQKTCDSDTIEEIKQKLKDKNYSDNNEYIGYIDINKFKKYIY